MKVMHYLERIGGVAVYPIVALSIFFLVFTLLGIWAFSVSRKYVNEMASLPLGGEPEIPSTTQPNLHEPSKF